MELLKLLKERPGLSAAEIAEATGWSKELVHQTLMTVMRSGCVGMTPKRYELTDRGATRADWVPKTPEKERIRLKRKREDAKVARMSPEDRKAANDTMVGKALASQHPLATAWGRAA